MVDEPPFGGNERACLLGKSTWGVGYVTSSCGDIYQGSGEGGAVYIARGGQWDGGLFGDGAGFGGGAACADAAGCRCGGWLDL